MRARVLELMHGYGQYADRFQNLLFYCTHTHTHTFSLSLLCFTFKASPRVIKPVFHLSLLLRYKTFYRPINIIDHSTHDVYKIRIMRGRVNRVALSEADCGANKRESKKNHESTFRLCLYVILP
jgi:hypothetical protein